MLLQEAIFQIFEYYTPKKIKKIEKKRKMCEIYKIHTDVGFQGFDKQRRR